MILHIVLYQPKDDVTGGEEAAFKAILDKAANIIPSIRQTRVGRTVDLGIGYEIRSEDQLYEYVAIFEFADTDGLKAYMAHPAHIALAEQFWKHCQRTMILDVEAEDPTARAAAGAQGL